MLEGWSGRNTVSGNRDGPGKNVGPEPALTLTLTLTLMLMLSLVKSFPSQGFVPPSIG